MITDVALRWVVTILFVVSIVECAYALRARRMAWPATVNVVLHLLMSVAMIVMAWPFGMAVPSFPPTLFFALAAIWFAGIGGMVATRTRDRVVNGYHALMMAAMAWMYAGMSGGLLSDPSSHAPNHPGMNMPGMDMPSDESADGTAGWMVAINGAIVGFFAIATVYWLYRYVTERRREPSTSGWFACAGALAQAFMAAGMAISFAVML